MLTEPHLIGKVERTKRVVKVAYLRVFSASINRKIGQNKSLKQLVLSCCNLLHHTVHQGCPTGATVKKEL